MIKYWKKDLCNISNKAKIGDGTIIHTFVSIHDDVVIGKNCQVENGVFIPTGVTIEDNVFIGPGVMFSNDKTLEVKREDWKPITTLVKSGAKIGMGALIRAGIVIGKNSIIGMGSIVLNDVPDNEVWVGSPVRFLRKRNDS